MQPSIFNEAHKIWTRIAHDAKEEDLKFSIAIHQQLLSFFQVGEYYYYVFNVKESVFEMLSQEVTAVLGYRLDEMNVAFFLSCIHPDDQPYFLNFENKVVEFFATLSPEQILNYKVRYDYRIKKSNDIYIRILQQVVTIQFDPSNNQLLRTFGVHTDISHLKMHGSPVLSFIGLNGEPSYINVAVKSVYSSPAVNISKREREILQLLIEGENSITISKKLFISKLTVDTHRRNLLRKAGCNNTTTLMALAIKKGWL